MMRKTAPLPTSQPLPGEVSFLNGVIKCPWVSHKARTAWVSQWTKAYKDTRYHILAANDNYALKVLHCYRSEMMSKWISEGGHTRDLV